ncbi:patatin-like phospholipase family protein [Acinetobacter sp. CUI P1]|nr:patatin-like phospholipase family protein [Acinetobacter sp. CUI P1]
MKVGLVLAGGGGKGAYQIGVIKALYELRWAKNIQAVAGTSVGALNAALFLNGDIQIAEDMWRNISPSKILSIKSPQVLTGIVGYANHHMNTFNQYIKKLEGFGMFSRTGLLQMIDESIDLDRVSTSPVPFYATCTAIPKWEKTYFQLNGLPSEKIKQVLLASSAIPGVFKPESIDGIKYIDGGFFDNVPIAPLYEMGCDVIIAVLLDRSATINKSMFPRAKIYEIVPQQAQGNFISGTLSFEGAKAEVRMQQGYEDAMVILQPIAAMAQNNRAFTQDVKQMLVDDHAFQIEHRKLQNSFKNSVQSLTSRMEKGKH